MVSQLIYHCDNHNEFNLVCPHIGIIFYFLALQLVFVWLQLNATVLLKQKQLAMHAQFLVYCHLVIWHTFWVFLVVKCGRRYLSNTLIDRIININKYKYNNKITVKKETLAVDKHWYGSLRNRFGVNAQLGYQEESVYAKHPQAPTCS